MTTQPEKPRVLVPIADGSEDAEFACLFDVLVRAGIQPVIASCNPTASTGNIAVTCARGLVVQAHCSFDESIGLAPVKSAAASAVLTGSHAKPSLADYAALAFAGGMPGAQTVGQHASMKQAIHGFLAQHAKTKILAAMCAAPVVNLAANDVFHAGSGENAGTVQPVCCFPMMKEKLPAGKVAFVDEPVVVAHHFGSSATVITSQGPGTALLFGLQIASHIVGEEAAAKVAGAMLVHGFRHLTAKPPVRL